MSWASWHVWRASFRRGRGRLGVGLLVGLALAVAAAVVGGARRTESTYDRFVEKYNVAELLVDGGDDGGLLADEVARLSGVVDYGRMTSTPVGLGTPSDFRPPPSGTFIHVVDDRFGVEVSRHVVLEGRLADPERLEVVATEPGPIGSELESATRSISRCQVLN